MITPTAQQSRIIDAQGDSVIIANPGSGKTFVLSEIIRKVLLELPEHKGVIAISYTNKASSELKRRSIRDGVIQKSSFFGTIDKFYLTEIIIPFGKHLFGLPINEFNVKLRRDLDENDQGLTRFLESELDSDELSQEQLGILCGFFVDGVVILESVGVLANYIFNNSIACKNYIKARYTHVIIDEYQDSGKEQHEIFLSIRSLGLTAIAVGDANQSIFRFSGKSPEYLIDLANNRDGFTPFPLDYNHRCHPSITNYSLLILNKDCDLLDCEDTRIFEKRVLGNERSIANWLDQAVPRYCEDYNVTQYNKVAVLVKNNRTAQTLDEHLAIDHKVFLGTPLDLDFTLWSSIFSELLSLLLDANESIVGFLENYLDVDYYRREMKNAVAIVKNLRDLIMDIDINRDEILAKFISLAELFHPSGRNENSIQLLTDVLNSNDMLESYHPAGPNQIQIMTLHKSKGLEFDIVFHLDLYEWILPKKAIHDREKYFPDLKQDINLHYVGITRAIKACVLCHSSRRTNWQGETKTGSPSEFLTPSYLSENRLNSPY